MFLLRVAFYALNKWAILMEKQLEKVRVLIFERKRVAANARIADLLNDLVA